MATKTENGMSFPAEAYAYVPDAKDPSSWKLRLWESPDKKVTAAQVGRAVAALTKGFRGKKVEIPAAERAAVLAKVRAAWTKANPDKKAADAPAALKEAASEELGQIGDLVCDAIGDLFQQQAATEGSYEPWAIEALFPDRVIVYRDGRYWAYDYTLADDNSVTLSAAGEVLETFTPVSSTAGTGAAAAMQEAGGVCLLEADAAGPAGAAYEAAIVRAGLALNSAKTYYPDAVLREAAPRFEGARMFVLPETEHLKPNSPEKGDARNIVGWISGARFVEGARPGTGYIAGKANFLAGELRDKIAEAWQRGKRDLVGLSIDALGAVRDANLQEAAAGAKRVAVSIAKVKSVDVITNASAGGALVRLVEAADDNKEQDPMKEKMLAAIKAKFPTLDVASLTEEQVLTRYAEAAGPSSTEYMTRADFDAHQRLQQARGAAAAKINATTLPAPAKAKLVERFGRLSSFTEADVDNEIKAERDYVVRMAEALGSDAGKVQLNAGDIQVEDRSVKIAHMFDALFNPGGKDAEGKLYPKVHSLKECYIEVTGDQNVTGRMENVDRSRLAEAGGAAFAESLDSASFSNVLGSSLTRRMVQDYNNVVEYDGYKQIIGTPVPLSDFRTQERVRFGGYGDLAIVAEGAPYTALGSPTDEKATYAPAKRGGTEDVTREMIKNDDIGAIRRIPVKMARAAKRTLAKFVFDFIRNNPAIYDGLTFFHATHGNLGATAFSGAEYGVVRVAMAKQTEMNSADRLGIYPNIIVYPVDMQETVWNAFQRNTNLDKTFIQQLQPIMLPVWYWTDTNDWAALANPSDIQVLEVGFVDGQEEPQMFVQDMPNVGSMFSNDKLTYKLRHEYGGAVVDYRGAYKEVV